MKLLPGLFAIVAAMMLKPPAANAAASIERFTPSSADPRVTRFDDPNVAIEPASGTGPAPLLVFFPGTAGRPENLLPLLQTAAAQGYRVLGLSYDNIPAVDQVCPQDPDPACAERFRRSRLAWDGASPTATPEPEAILTRLWMSLKRLAATHPHAGWNDYFAGDELAWPQIAVGGFSQGAGMAAMIGKLFPVRRVILFSGPWDVTGQDRRPAPWLSGRAATPPDRWWAERHVNERTTGLLARAYRTLGIPERQILLFDHPAAPPSGPTDNPAHRSTVRRADYLPQWKTLLGHAAGDKPA